MKRVPATNRDGLPSYATYGGSRRFFQRRGIGGLVVATLAVSGCGDVEPPLQPAAAQPPVAESSAMPHLVVDGTGALLSWLEPLDPADVEGTWRLATSRFEASKWSAREDITEREGMFINWADFPSVITSGNTSFAHWLQRGTEGGYDYAVNIQASGGEVVDSEPYVLHEDTAPVEHGFVSSVPLPGGRVGVIWLDGRDFTGDEPHEMQVRYREVGPDGPLTSEALLDNRACDCCQTDLALSGDDLVAVYRDRSEAEIRDISVVRTTGDGWSEPVRIHDDGWEIAGCPVNGPAIAASGAQVVVAWFTAAHDSPRVNLAFSSDGGRTFDAPVLVDEGAALGRVDVVLLAAGASGAPAAAVSWVERSDGEGGAELHVRKVVGAEAGGDRVVSSTTAARSSGFPQMVRLGDDLLFAWTDTELARIRTLTLPTSELH